MEMTLHETIRWLDEGGDGSSTSLKRTELMSWLKELEALKAEKRASGYDDGYAKGFEVGKAQGLNDAWGLAHRITTEPCYGGLPREAQKEIFPCFSWQGTPGIFSQYTAAEAMKMVRDWEKSKKEIHVGDVVKYGDRTAVVSAIHECNNIDRYILILDDGMTATTVDAASLVRTNRNMDIQAILRWIKGDEDES